MFSEIMSAPDKGIPRDLLADAHCIVIVPSLKTAAFGVGGEYGKGYLSCRNKSGGGWSAPGTVRIEGGSVGFQIGGSTTDLIMLVMSERGADKLLASKFTLGAEGSAAAGPVGRTAKARDAIMHADILSWSRSQGLFFAGVGPRGRDAAPRFGRQRRAVRKAARRTAPSSPAACARRAGGRTDCADEPLLDQGNELKSPSEVTTAAPGPPVVARLGPAVAEVLHD